MKIAVTSPSFSKHPELVREMQQSFTDFKLNEAGVSFSEDELIDYLKDADAAIIGLDDITPRVIDSLPKLRMIAKYGVGLNNIDVDYCLMKGVKIGWTGGVNRLSVAEMVIANAISLLRNLYVTSNLLSAGVWQKNGGIQLSGKTVGVIGVGHIGKEVIRLLAPFHCRILANDVVEQDDYYRQVGAIPCDKETIFREADVITIHTPLNESTRNLVNADSLALMKKHAILINTARGGIIDEQSLARALRDGQIGGAALDVYATEPAKDMELLGIPNLICTPHIGGNSKEAVYAMGMSAIGHLRNFVLE